MLKKRVGSAQFLWFLVRTFFPFKEARFCDLIICTIEAAISRVRGECKRREGEKTENEILLFFNLKSRFGKEQEREYRECLNTSASAEGSQRDFFISNNRVLSLFYYFIPFSLPRVEHGTVDGVEIGEEVFVVVVVVVVVFVDGEETQKRFSE